MPQRVVRTKIRVCESNSAQHWPTRDSVEILHTHILQSLEPLLAWLESCMKGRPLAGTPEGLVLVKNARALPVEGKLGSEVIRQSNKGRMRVRLFVHVLSFHPPPAGREWRFRQVRKFVTQ